MSVEREITEAVDLCRPDGRLSPDAVGWSRHPLHRTGLRGWGRSKRWEYWGLVTPEHIVGITVSSLDYAGVHSVYLLERASGSETNADAVVPFGRGALLAPRAGVGGSRVTTKALAIALDETPEGTRIRVRTPVLDLDVVALLPERHESLSVVVPWSEKLFQYTVKDLGRPLRGRLRVAGLEHEVDPDESFGVLDHGRGRWPYAITWNWGAGYGRVEGREVALQVGGRWTDGTGSTENALFVDGVAHKISEDLAWDYDAADWLAPWRIRGERVDARFTPFHERASVTNLGVLASEVHQCFGTWSGWATTDEGERVALDGIVGWAEEARNRW
ncbi:MAG: DUF2804 domain-containing protein [Candidatus Nanopelagicales bacterium]